MPRSYPRPTLIRYLVLLAACLAAIVPSQVFAASSSPENDAELLELVDDAIAKTSFRHLDFQVHTPWQILHGLLALRENYVIKNGDQMVNVLEHISNGARYKGNLWFEATQHGAKAHPYNGTPFDFEGHVNQTLAIVAMCNPSLDHKFLVEGGKTVTMKDMIKHAQMSVNTREETTWTLWFLTHYLDQDTQWVNSQGQRWSMESLVRIQTAASPIGAPCGGTHSLFALAYARNSYLQKHGELRGVWLEADQKLQRYIAAAQAMQNRDGSFATEFFKARGFSTDFNERIKSSGHMLEWLMMALPRKRLDEAWVVRGVERLARDLIENASAPAECGPLYHSLHALTLYRQRMAPDLTPTAPAELATAPNAKPLDAGSVVSVEPDKSADPNAETLPQITAQPPSKPVLVPQETAQAQSPARTESVAEVSPKSTVTLETPGMKPELPLPPVEPVRTAEVPETPSEVPSPNPKLVAIPQETPMRTEVPLE
ncbi:MAG: hypothetical protein KDA80_21355, partial [Planctomycetaceae bacterium]|nr:hypothetical protein [Planctomycetaceae bacterium]